MKKELSIKEIAKDINEVISSNPDVVKKIGVFGSFARGDFNHESDIDLLIEYNMPSDFVMDSFTVFCNLCNKIEDMLTRNYNRKVDIVHFENGSPSTTLGIDVEKEVLWL